MAGFAGNIPGRISAQLFTLNRAKFRCKRLIGSLLFIEGNDSEKAICLDIFNNLEGKDRRVGLKGNLIYRPLIDYRRYATACYSPFRSLTDGSHIDFLAILDNIGDPFTHIPIKKLDDKWLRGPFSHKLQPVPRLLINQKSLCSAKTFVHHFFVTRYNGYTHISSFIERVDSPGNVQKISHPSWK
ncbi:MAG: hypothetical protein L6365_16040 [Desulfobulbaceae bacterium]|nr:hypothetical protein [Desulfobulbaceae bacterium]